MHSKVTMEKTQIARKKAQAHMQPKRGSLCIKQNKRADQYTANIHKIMWENYSTGISSQLTVFIYRMSQSQITTQSTKKYIICSFICLDKI